MNRARQLDRQLRTLAMAAVLVTLATLCLADQPGDQAPVDPNAPASGDANAPVDASASADANAPTNPNTSAGADANSSQADGNGLGLWARKDDPNSPFAGPKNDVDLISRTLVSVVIVLVLGVAAWIVTRKVLPRTFQQGRRMNVAETVHLGPKKTVHLLKVGKQEFLVGAAGDNVTMLTELMPQSSEGTQTFQLPDDVDEDATDHQPGDDSE
jgi:flagellar biogenesis protein FliO